MSNKGFSEKNKDFKGFRLTACTNLQRRPFFAKKKKKKKKEKKHVKRKNWVRLDGSLYQKDPRRLFGRNKCCSPFYLVVGV